MATRRGLQRLIHERFGPVWNAVALVQVLLANVVTLGADLAGGAAALEILTGVGWRWWVLPFALAVALFLLYGSYASLYRALRVVLLVFLAYLGALVLVRPNWGEVLRATFVPTVVLAEPHVAGALALLGSTLTSYVFYWETIEQEEEPRPPSSARLVEVEACLGIVFAMLTFWAILVATAATLGAEGRAVETAADAAQALVPLAGPLAGVLFAVGLLASAVLSIPVLAGTIAHVVAEAFAWPEGLSQPLRRETWPFYGTVLGCLAAGVVLALFGPSPVTFLFLAGLVAGLGTPVVLALMVILAQDDEVMRGRAVRGWIAVVAWLTVVFMGLASVAYAGYLARDVAAALR
jgi:Mn2+/Fe2+ NRAMP family transporter